MLLIPLEKLTALTMLAYLWFELKSATKNPALKEGYAPNFFDASWQAFPTLRLISLVFKAMPWPDMRTQGCVQNSIKALEHRP